MIHSSPRDRKTKAIAEALAIIADVHPELDSHGPRPIRESDEWLWECATEFCAALDRFADRAMEMKRDNRRSPSAPAARAHRVAPIPHRLSNYFPGETLPKF
jgi:hypothetical protein